MQNQLKPLFVILLWIGVNGVFARPIYQDTVGIEISQIEFDKKVELGLILVHSTKEESVEEYILLTRLYNTIEIAAMDEKKSNYKEFMKLFILNQKKRAVVKLEAKLSQGMAYHSRKYDIWIGGFPHSNSKFRII